MRELKFRAWDEELGEYLYSFNYNGYEISDNEGVIYISKILDGSGETPCLEIEQYTGVKDKNGTKGFEGDVARYFEKGVGLYPHDAKFPDAKNAVNDTDRIGVITLNPECRIGTMMITNNDSNKIEIIGNIHTHNEDGTLK